MVTPAVRSAALTMLSPVTGPKLSATEPLAGVTVIDDDKPLSLPAASVTFAFSVRATSACQTKVGAHVHVPSDSARVFAITVVPSTMLTTAPASAVPVISGRAAVIFTAVTAIAGVVGTVPSTVISFCAVSDPMPSLVAVDDIVYSPSPVSGRIAVHMPVSAFT